jgi:hypothetical protein
MTTPYSTKFKNPGFEECAVICTGCELKGDIYDSWDSIDFGHIRLFLKPEG